MKTKTFLAPCPNCGTIKRVTFSINNWTKTDYTFWSDSRIDSNDWREHAYTHVCRTCGKFFVLPPLGTMQVDDTPDTPTELLPFPMLKAAVAELAGDESAEPRARLEAFWAYNALYTDSNDIPDPEQAFHQANMTWLRDFHAPRATRFSHLVFELNRLLGNKEDCEKMIEVLTYEEYVKQREARFKEKGIESILEDKYVREMYDSLIEELRFALTRPPRPYIKHK